MRAFLLLALLSLPAFAQKVIILELDGDSKDKLRAQIEEAVRASGANELISLKDYKAAAAKKKMTGAAAMTPVGVARAAKVIAIDAAVGGEVSGGKYNVVIYDRTGGELWTKSLKVTKGLLSDDFAGKLARAITAAAQQGAAKPQEDAGGGEQTPEMSTGLDLTQTDSAGNVGVVTDVSNNPKPEPERDVDLDDPYKKKASEIVPVPIFRVWVAGATTWRSQCLRPGVTSCKQYDTAATKPAGVTIDFAATVPYFGLSLNAELFPLARVNAGSTKGVNALAQGLGLLVNFQYGQSLTRVVDQNAQGSGAEQTVKSNDLGFMGQVAYRYHFEMGVAMGAQEAGPYYRKQASPVGWVGLRGGIATRNFVIDPNANLSLPSSQRAIHGVVGLDVALAILPQLRFEFGGSIFMNPKPSAEQIIGYGNLKDPTGGATAFGFGIEAGVAGQIWGPIGYTVRWRMTGYKDTYYGQGQKWIVCNDTQCGGVGEETYHSLIFGLTASY